MTAKPMDPISSFENILENVPTWRIQLRDLSIHATKKYDEYVAEYSKLLHKAKVKARRTKSASMASLHTNDKDEPAKSMTQPEASLRSPQTSDLVEISPLEAGNRFIYAQAHKKRKPGTSLRSNASGPRNFRSKQMVVVYYDSYLQSELDRLVKGFGAARNNLRKGKNSYSAAKGFLLPSLSKRHDGSENLVFNPTSRSAPRLSKTQSEPAIPTTEASSSAESAFLRADKELEAIQSLCENAAHQVIRDGDCNLELTDAASKLDLLVAFAESTLDLLKAEKKKDEEEAATNEHASVSGNTSTQSTLCEKPSLEALGSHPKTLPPLVESMDCSKRPPLPTTVSAPPGRIMSDTIEVDDDDDDDDDDSSIEIDLNMANYRSIARARITT